MYGEFEILLMIDELRREERLAAVRLHHLTKIQLACQPSKAASKSPILAWIGTRLVALGCRLLVDRQPGLAEQLRLMNKV